MLGAYGVTVVSVLNYKGGVGKTTVTANLGADLAYRGRRVLLIDLDPQASLTFSFYTADEWDTQLRPSKTVLHWYDSFNWSSSTKSLGDLVTTPPRVNALVRQRGGQLDLIASDLGLVDVELDLAAGLGGSRYQTFNPDYLTVHRLLADALGEGEFAGYDMILIDCPPNFNMVTRTAVVASQHILVPAKADYLSTLGITYLRRRLTQLVEQYNGVAGPAPEACINPEVLGVVFTMIQYAGSNLMTKIGNYIDRAGETEVPVFRQNVRESKSVFADAGELGIPAVLAPHATQNVEHDLKQLTSEFIARTRI
ncbi:cobyrinic acid a,c-diamide synthase [Phytohabitans suffuscus]|uniref:Cobyrinic acid a,c-diamide synthase n=1 Tax=Phytohabitans suffuscus TaxID=624315 RepID=A0A6F8YKC0_9ACTN|nr:cobyrinic acid a,c-diamide synthase [Phytohabitans suffuscus]